MRVCACVTGFGSGASNLVPVSTSHSAAAAGDESDDDGKSTTVVVDLQAVMQHQMELAIKSSLTQPLPNCMNDKSLLAAIKSEMAVFECSGVRGRILQLVYSYLQSIPPTSVDAERAFSAAGIFCTKVRSSLGDTTLDTLCIIHSYYRKR